MGIAAAPLRFSHHLVGVLAGSAVGPACAALALAVMMGVAGYPARLLVEAFLLGWLAIGLLAVPAAAVVLSLLWPVTRRGTTAARWVCVTAGVTAGILLAPLSSKGMQGASPKQMLVFAAIGVVVAGVYCLTVARLGRPRRPIATLRDVFA